MDENQKEQTEMKVIAEFTKIPGVGLSKAKKLYEMGYRSMDDLKKASFEELAAIKGIGENRATLIKNYFAEEKKEAAEKTVAEEKAEAVEAKPEEKKEEEKETEKEIEEIEKELGEVEKVLAETKGRETKIVFEKKVEKKEGLVNGLKIKPAVVKKAKKPSMGAKIAAGLIVAIMVFSSIFLLWYALIPESRITIDGRIDDWVAIAKFRESPSSPISSIDIEEYGMFFENKRINFFAKTSGEIFGANSGVDALRIFMDVDGNSATGYAYQGIGAEYKIEIIGWEGQIYSATLQRFISEANRWNYSAWENYGEVRTEKSGNTVEGYVKITGIENLVAIFGMVHYDAQNIVEKICGAPVSQKYAALAITQRFLGGDTVNASEDVLELKISARGGDVEIQGIDVSNAAVNLPKNRLAIDEEITVIAKAKRLSEGSACEFALRSVNTEVPYHVVGSGGKAYFGNLPQGIVIDGAFGDW
ncbi:MAG: helix-hairpin-helix domain-containing protein, partial [Thermoplasmata archaeon]